MAGEQDLLRAIALMKAGDLQSASPLLQRAVDDPDLDAHGQAAAWIWLAESREDHGFKIDCLRRALHCAPENASVEQKLNRLLAERELRPAEALHLEAAPPVLRVSGGANGMGSGLFINDEGLAATTSSVLGGALIVRIGIDGEHDLHGQVLRRFPQSDLALIETAVTLSKLDALPTAPAIITKETVIALGCDGVKCRGSVHDAGENRSGWLWTDIALELLSDAGGNPLYDSRGQVLGLLTRSSDHASEGAWAVSIARVMTLAEQALQEKRLTPHSACCGACGSLTVASHYGGHYCETCGAILPDRGDAGKQPADAERLSRIYGEMQSRPCPNCVARVGYYLGKCLRCSHELARGSLRN